MPRQSKEFKGMLRQSQQSQYKQKSLAELVQNLQESGLEEMASKMVIEPPGAEKMSEVLRKFIAPYMNSVNHIEEYRSLLDLAVIAWNTSLLPEAKQQEMIDTIFEKNIFKGDKQAQQEVREIISEFIARKNQYFAEIKRFIVQFNCKDTGKEYHLSVASTLFEMKPDDMADS